MISRRIYQNGVSLVESLIALAILLFIMFTVFILLGSLISTGYTLNKKTSDSQNIRNAIEEFKSTGKLDENAFGKNFSDNPNNADEYVIRIYSKGNSESDIYIVVKKPHAKINLLSCSDDGTTATCTFNANGSTGEKIKVKYSSKQASVTLNPSDGVVDTPQASVEGTFEVGNSIDLLVTDVYGNTSNDTYTITQEQYYVVVTPPTAVAITATCDTDGYTCQFSAGNSYVSAAGDATYKWDFGGAVWQENGVTTTDKNHNYDIDYPATGSYQVTLTVTDSLGKSKKASKYVNAEQSKNYVTAGIDPLSLRIVKNGSLLDVTGKFSVGGRSYNSCQGNSCQGSESVTPDKYQKNTLSVIVFPANISVDWTELAGLLSDPDSRVQEAFRLTDISATNQEIDTAQLISSHNIGTSLAVDSYSDSYIDIHGATISENYQAQNDNITLYRNIDINNLSDNDYKFCVIGIGYAPSCYTYFNNNKSLPVQQETISVPMPRLYPYQSDNMNNLNLVYDAVNGSQNYSGMTYDVGVSGASAGVDASTYVYSATVSCPAGYALAPNAQAISALKSYGGNIGYDTVVGRWSKHNIASGLTDETQSSTMLYILYNGVADNNGWYNWGYGITMTQYLSFDPDDNIYESSWDYGSSQRTSVICHPLSEAYKYTDIELNSGSQQYTRHPQLVFYDFDLWSDGREAMSSSGSNSSNWPYSD